MTKKCILFFAEAVTLAHVARPVVLAQALNPDLYDVHLACDSRFNKLFPKLSFSHRPIYSIPSKRFIETLARGSPLYDLHTLRAYVKEDLEVIDEVKPDLVVGDFRISLAVSSSLAGTPYMAISNAYWSPFARQRFPVPELPLAKVLGLSATQALFNLARPFAFAYHSLPLNRTMREYGLPSLGLDLRRVYTCADYTLYADIPEMFPTFDLPTNHYFIGPILWSPSVPLPDWWDELPQDRPIIYVTLGSSGRSEVLPAVLDALANMPVIMIAATAGRIELDHVPENAFLTDYLPGAAAVARAKLVICNGGSPTAQQALAGGVPVLGIANNMDQHLNMEAVQRAGAGERIRSERADAVAIRGVVLKMLERPFYTKGSRRLAELFSNYSSANQFVELVAEVV